MAEHRSGRVVDVSETASRERQTDLRRTDETQALPEAPISICMKGTLGGVPGTMVTLRGHDIREIEIRAQQVKVGAQCLVEIFDADTPAQTRTAVVPMPTCPDHHNPMKPSKFCGWYCPPPMMTAAGIAASDEAGPVVSDDDATGGTTMSGDVGIRHHQ